MHSIWLNWTVLPYMKYEISPTPLTALLVKLQNVYHNVRHKLLAKILLLKKSFF